MKFFKNHIHKLPITPQEFLNIKWLFFDRAFRTLGTFLIFAFAARHLGAHDFGDFNAGLSLVLTLGLFCSLGLQATVITQLVKAPNKSDEILTNALFVQILASLSIFIAIISYQTLILSRPIFEKNIINLLLLTLLLKPFDVFRYWFEYRVSSRYFIISDCSSFIATIFLKIYAIYFAKSIIFLSAIIVIEQLLSSIIIVFIFKYRGPKISLQKISFTRIKKMVLQSIPLLVTGISIATYTRIDQFLILHFNTAQSLGVYFAAYRLAELAFAPITIVGSSVFPKLNNLHNIDNELFEKTLRQFLTYSFYILAIFACFITIFAQPIINLIYGKSYSESIELLRIIIWSAPFVALGVFGNHWQLSKNMQNKMLLISLSGAIISAGLNFALIPNIGILGAAITSLVVQIFITLLCDMLFKETRFLFKLKISALIFKDIKRND